MEAGVTLQNFLHLSTLHGWGHPFFFFFLAMALPSSSSITQLSGPHRQGHAALKRNETSWCDWLWLAPAHAAPTDNLFLLIHPLLQLRALHIQSGPTHSGLEWVKIRLRAWHNAQLHVQYEGTLIITWLIFQGGVCRIWSHFSRIYEPLTAFQNISRGKYNYNKH